MGQKEYILDPVIGAYDYEKPYSEKKDFAMNELSGIPIQFLNGIDRDGAVELVDVIVGNDLKGIDGLGSEKEQDEVLFRYLVRTRNLIQNNSELVKNYQNPEQALQMFNYAIKYWNTDKRHLALERLAKVEQSLIGKGEILLGIDSGDDEYDWEEDTEFSGFEGEHPDYKYIYYESPEDIGDLGKKGNAKSRKKASKKKGGFFDKLKNANKKIIDAHKKVGKKLWDVNKKIVKGSVNAVLKYNPVSVTARQGLLVALRTNMFKMADKLKYAYLTEDQARERGLDIEEWKKLCEKYKKVVKMFTKTLKGKEDLLKKAILSGKRKDFLNGVTFGELGEAATAAASTAAASTFIATIVAWLKKIDFSKLSKSAKGAKDAGLFKKNPDKKAFKEEYKKEHGGKSKGWRKEWKEEKADSDETTDTGEDTFNDDEGQGKKQGEKSLIETNNDADAGDNEKPGLWNTIKGWSVPKKIGAGVGVVALLSGIALASSKKLRQKVGLQKPEAEAKKAPNQANTKPNPALSGTQTLEQTPKRVKLS